MNKIYIYVEGKSDKEFLDCYLRYLSKDSKYYEIIPNGSNAINAKYKSGQENLFTKIKSHKDNAGVFPKHHFSWRLLFLWWILFAHQSL